MFPTQNTETFSLYWQPNWCQCCLKFKSNIRGQHAFPPSSVPLCYQAADRSCWWSRGEAHCHDMRAPNEAAQMGAFVNGDVQTTSAASSSTCVRPRRGRLEWVETIKNVCCCCLKWRGVDLSLNWIWSDSAFDNAIVFDCNPGAHDDRIHTTSIRYGN